MSVGLSIRMYCTVCKGSAQPLLPATLPVLERKLFDLLTRNLP